MSDQRALIRKEVERMADEALIRCDQLGIDRTDFYTILQSIAPKLTLPMGIDRAKQMFAMAFETLRTKDN